MSTNGPPEAPPPASRIDYLYREYSRAADSVDALGKSSFEDFKLLAALGAILAWPPIAKSNPFGDGASDDVVLFGLLAALFIVGILAVRNFLKLSAMEFWVREVRILEDQLRAALELEATDTFRSARRWQEWVRDRHSPIAVRFQLLFACALLLFPIVALALIEAYWHAAVYLAVAVIVSGVVQDARRKFQEAAR